jgi:hypothetical protein
VLCTPTGDDARAERQYWEFQELMFRENRTPVESEAVESKYANYFRVGHNAFEFIVEFAQLYSEPAMEKVHTRIVTGPAYAKELLAVLKKSVEDYEREFGAIPEQE